jgi:ATP-dependent Lhr-like helicase
VSARKRAGEPGEGDALAPFRPATRAWFRERLGEPTRAQSLAFPPIARGESTLLLAPTGSGKTLAAFLAAIDALVHSEEPDRGSRCRVLYVSPLKALAVDVEKNLRAPLAGIVETAERRGDAHRVPTVDVRTGDTPPSARARMIRRPPDVLITTPESLYLLLTSGARATLASVDAVIVDEIHALVPTKRGAHLFVSLERLEALRRAARKDAPPLQRIGLSATQRPLDEVARLLGGFQDGAPRPVTIVDASAPKRLELSVSLPEIDPGQPPATIWPLVHRRLVDIVRAHRSTIVFVNARRQAERLAAAMNDVAGEEIALAHHGSVAREKRTAIEERLKRGELPAIVATSSLELGIDMGAVDLVVQIEAPPSVASGMQRIGRASHGVGGVPKGILLPTHRADVLACATAVRGMRAGEVEETFYPRSPLDVLAQQIVAMAASEEHLRVDDLFDRVRGAAPFAELSRRAFEGVLDMLSGRYPSDDFRDLRARVTWDRARGRVSAREGALRLAVSNGGTIPDRGLYGVFVKGGDERTSRRVGELDEEMVFELRPGEVFLLGATSWRAEEITHERVVVSPAAGEPGKMPFWHGDRAGRPRAFGARIGELARGLSEQSERDARRTLERELDLDASAAKNLAAYVHAQRAATGEVPSDRAIVVERLRDEMNDWRVCVMTPFGSRVHAPWATAILARLKERREGEVQAVWSDDGIALRMTGSEAAPDAALFFPPHDAVERIVTDSLGGTSFFAARFRECAARALLLPRRSPGKRTPLWAQRKRAYDLLAVAARYPSFPIVLEAYRECLRDVFDLPGLVAILRDVESRRIRVATCDTRVPSPFAASLLFSFVGRFIYDDDAPLAERRAQALTIDHAQLRELLGEAELRKLLDARVIAEHARSLQRLPPLDPEDAAAWHPTKSADALHDRLLALGDLSMDEIAARATSRDDARAWVRALEEEGRIARATIAGETRFVAMEDVARYRDAIGVAPPANAPAALLEPVASPLEDLVSRFARTHGPFTIDEVRARFGLGREGVERAVAALIDSGRIVEGAFLPEGGRDGVELCDAEVLRALRRKSLAKLRRDVEPVDAATYARFQIEWHALAEKRRGSNALVDAIAQLQGCALAASSLEARVLPARVEGYRAWDLDALCAAGRVTWAGVETLGASDGRVALYLAEDEALLSPPPGRAEGELAGKVRDVLAARGAIFFAEIARAVGGYPGAVLDALWDLVWSGEATNDTLEPLRARLASHESKESKRRPSPRQPRARVDHSALPGSQGRWSLRAPRLGRATDTERSAALARALLDRYGVLARESVQAEGIPGGFSAVYEVLKAMEDAGRVRRGYFLADRAATQFALPGAEERLRALREPAPRETARTFVLDATDPASPYGATLPWPASRAAGEASPQRAAGALVVIREGALLGWIARTGGTVLTFHAHAHADADALASALASLVDRDGRRALLLESIDGEPAAKSPLGPALARAGFVRSGEGAWLRRPLR